MIYDGVHWLYYLTRIEAAYDPIAGKPLHCIVAGRGWVASST
jgi:hypothetical protein